MQGFLRNPLAEPGILGVSSGAALGAVIVLYFGFAAGPGIFFKQLEDESSLSLDYQLFLGLRLFNIFDSTGFYIESGLRNHLHITSDGQLNGTYFGAGAVFTF